MGQSIHCLLGQTLTLTALGTAAFGSVMGFIAGRRQSLKGLAWSRNAAYVFSAAMILANVVMLRALIVHDFGVGYVAKVGSRDTPLHITIPSLWSSLDGSLLFWGAILGVFVGAFVYLMRDRYHEYQAYAIGTLLAVGLFFAFLIAGPADPFVQVSPVPADGPGPNPLLQNHILMAVHPPMLYLGYVGLTLPFAIAVAALLRGRMSDGWLRSLRRWTLVPWTFLTLGIVMGGWWAYEVLGWGGYWAWDPVENASLLPWLTTTAYLHSAVVQERKRMLKAWTLGLVMASFLLTILGTFMTRSGVFNSVHSFTQSSIGPLFLGFLTVTFIFTLGLVAGRSHLLEPEGKISSLLSRESAFLLNNLAFAVLTFTVLLGTIFPLLTEAIQGAKVSVGEPYFNRMAVPLGLVILVLMGLGPALPWGRPLRDRLLRSLAVPVSVAIVIAVGAFVLGMESPVALLSFSLCGFTAVVTVRELFRPAWDRAKRRNESVFAALLPSLSDQRRRTGGYIVHIAVIISIGAITASQVYRETVEVSLQQGESTTVGGYQLTYKRLTGVDEKHRFSVTAFVEVGRDGRVLGELAPRMNFYPRQREPILTPYVTTLGIDDVYLSLITFDRESQQISIKAFVIPMVSWLWGSLPVVCVGAAISLWPRRKRKHAFPAGAAAKTA